ncbi:hypothetical protein NB699_003306 [Xanthomonas sacchari]|nr:hypothetical protein [Xanthomonas sacchari]MCW0441740.1 hypothetical protein [Xanthomonas sacchari]
MTPTDGHFHRQLAHWLLRSLPRGAARQVGTLSVGIASDVGIVRFENEDRVAACRARDKFGHHFVVVAVADGIGGMQDGMECAATAIAAIFETVYREATTGAGRPALWLEKALNTANELVHNYYGGKGGTTIAVTLVGDVGRACWATVGDTRIYEFKGQELVQLSKDDTIAGQLGRSNEDSPEQSLLLQYVGMGSGLVLSITEFDRREDRQLLLCTDGVYFVSPDRKLLKQVLGTARKLDAAAAPRRLVEIAKWAGGPDNASAAVISFPDNLATGISYPAPGIEVWDSYGEIFFVLGHNEQGADAAHPEQPRPHVRPKAKKAKKTPAKSGQSKSSKKKGGSAAVEPDNDTDALPQVQLSFSNDN